ncbi:nectin-4-like isoform X2 [Gouania willdenowi]|uniref:nectin-4-like isoform X2 n=1 Tax=Gouania willdenowi TaxID=441366 RepID=UPI0010561E6D|nr:nectin-4-like isoform X2 [Gouania willdenowi]
MEGQTWCLASLFLIAVCVHGDFVEPSQPVISMNSLAESQTRLPCHYEAEGEGRVVQVSWYKEVKGGSKEQIITAHFEHGHKEFGRYSGRVRFETTSPTKNAALLIISTEESDEGSYTCRIVTYPNGNFERQITLTVWVSPISSLDPVILTEGQNYGVVATCRAVGRPIPRLSWDSDLPGQVQERTNEGGSVSSYFSLHPLRSMNGKKLDCMVSHPSLTEPRRIPNRLVVQYPPDPTISTFPGHFYESLENAELLCQAGGNPKPHNITWTWNEGDLPVGVSLHGEKLVFGRTLRMNDSGVYVCKVTNSVGHGKSEFVLRVSDQSPFRAGFAGDNLLLIIIGAAAGGLVLVLVIAVLLVNRHHRNRNKKLEIELSEKKEEINNFSRQNSFRGLNSLSSDPRLRGEDYSGLRVDSRMKNSQVSLERPAYRGSQSTLGGKWGPPVGVELDELGRPVVWQDGRESLRGAEIDGEKEERRRRVESYLKSSNMSLAQQEDGSSSSPREPDLSCHQQERDPPSNQQVWVPPGSVAEGHEDDDGDSSSYQISEALTNHFYYSNGILRPRPHSNAILLHPRGQII